MFPASAGRRFQLTSANKTITDIVRDELVKEAEHQAAKKPDMLHRDGGHQMFAATLRTSSAEVCTPTPHRDVETARNYCTTHYITFLYC